MKEKFLLKALPSKFNTNKYDNDFGDFIYAPYGAYVTAFECNKKTLTFHFQNTASFTLRCNILYT